MISIAGDERTNLDLKVVSSVNWNSFRQIVWGVQEISIDYYSGLS